VKRIKRTAFEHIYVIAREEEFFADMTRYKGPFKIGKTRDPKARLMSFNVASPVRIDYAFLSQAMDKELCKKIEVVLHLLNDEWRENGEWFYPVDPVRFWGNIKGIMEVVNMNKAVLK
jgi:hypothetical protein